MTLPFPEMKYFSVPAALYDIPEMEDAVYSSSAKGQRNATEHTFSALAISPGASYLPTDSGKSMRTLDSSLLRQLADPPPIRNRYRLSYAIPS